MLQRSIAVIGLIAALAASATIAIAHTDGGSTIGPPSPVAADPEAQAYISALPQVDQQVRQAIAQGKLDPATAREPDQNIIPAAPVPEQILDMCKQEETNGEGQSFSCRVAEATASGELEPGSYTNRELEEIVGPR